MIDYDDRIDKTKARIDPCVLTCDNHPTLRWYTKNIGFIGARTIFYSGRSRGPECDCNISHLMVVKD